jgi:hypothetical protein
MRPEAANAGGLKLRGGALELVFYTALSYICMRPCVANAGGLKLRGGALGRRGGGAER